MVCKDVCGHSATVAAFIGPCLFISLGRNVVCDTFAVAVRPLQRCLKYALSFFRAGRGIERACGVSFFRQSFVCIVVAVVVRPLPRS